MNVPFLLRRLTAICISVGVGLVFLYSGYTKLFPVIETFEFTFVEAGVANWYTAPVLARLMIALEFFAGALLISCFRLRRLTLPFTAGLLIFFIIYLALLIVVSGNHGNCGCFGEHHMMTPLQGIIKNVILTGLTVLAAWLYRGWDTRYGKLLLAFAGLTCVVVPFVVNPVDYTYSSNNLEEEINYDVGISALYEAADTSKVERPEVDLREGKHVVAFLSLRCPHCRIAARKMHIIKKEDPSLPVYFVLNGKKSDYPDFLEYTGADNVPSSFCLGKTFVQLAGNRLPRIYYLDDGIVVKKVDYFELSQYDIAAWVAAP